MILVRTELPQDSEIVRKLLDLAFGPDRYKKTVYRLREGTLPIRHLCFAAEYMGEVRGSLRFWPVVIQSEGTTHDALLLGPLAVDPGIRGRGVGESLMNEGLKAAKDAGFTRIILVGDVEYYSAFGFATSYTENLQLPGPVDRHRFLGLELEPGAFQGVSGKVGPALPSSSRATFSSSQTSPTSSPNGAGPSNTATQTV